MVLFILENLYELWTISFQVIGEISLIGENLMNLK